MNLGDKVRNINVRVNDEMWNWLGTESEKLGKTRSEYIRIVLRVGMVTTRSAEQVFNEVKDCFLEEQQPAK